MISLHAGRLATPASLIHPEPMHCPAWTIFGALERVGASGGAHPTRVATSAPAEQDSIVVTIHKLSVFRRKGEQFIDSRAPHATHPSPYAWTERAGFLAPSKDPS